MNKIINLIKKKIEFNSFYLIFWYSLLIFVFLILFILLYKFSLVMAYKMIKLYYLFYILFLINIILIIGKNSLPTKISVLVLNVFCFYIISVINYKYSYFDNYYNINLITEMFDFYFFKFEINYDGISLLLINLTLILGFICYIFIFTEANFTILAILINLIIFFLVIAFSTYNLLLFYISFETILIPVFLMIGLAGSRERKLSAAFRLFFYTLIGSFFFLSFLLFIYYTYGTFDLFFLKQNIYKLDLQFQLICWLCMFITFAIKIPIYPFHTWLPEAHAEAPTVGSILLAGILSKLGPYGFIRFANVLFPFAFFYFKPLVYLLCLLSIYYTAIIALRQLDIKKIIAYSSISHMALIILGIWSLTIEGVTGGVLLLIAHGFISGALFMLIGFMYQRYKTRIILYYGGLSQINPLLAFFFFLAILGNISFPLTMNFISEILIYISLFDLNIYIFILVIFSGIFILAYNLFLFNRLFFGRFSEFYIHYTQDLLNKEIMMLIILLIPVFYFGITSYGLTKFIESSIYSYIYDVNYILYMRYLL